MPKKLIFSLIFLFAFILPTFDLQANNADSLLQEIEVLKFEASLLQSLVKNMEAQNKISALAYLAVNLSDNSVLLEKTQKRPIRLLLLPN
jgi:hypothetical protein